MKGCHLPKSICDPRIKGVLLALGKLPERLHKLLAFPACANLEASLQGTSKQVCTYLAQRIDCLMISKQLLTKAKL